MLLGVGNTSAHDEKPLISSPRSYSSGSDGGVDEGVVVIPGDSRQMEFFLTREASMRGALQCNYKSSGKYSSGGSNNRYSLDQSLEGRSSCKAINPHSTFVLVWDILIGTVLAITAFVAPFEAAFLTSTNITPNVDKLFHFDRALDLLFIVDIGLQFFIMCPDPKAPSHLVRSPSKIAALYLRGGFIYDVLSVMPADLFLMIEGKGNSEAILPLLRLLRLLRLQRWSKLIQRWKNHVGISYAMLTVLEFFCATVLGCHWIACLWGRAGLAQAMAGQENNWISAVKKSKAGPDDFFENPFCVYIMSVYWSIMTLTGVGYGDIVAQNAAEYVISSCCIAAMSANWAYVVGSVCSLLATLNPRTVAFKQTMDDLNRIMEDRNMPSDFRRKLRMYFFESRDLQRKRSERVIVEQMSPMLQGEISMFVHQKWLSKIWYLKNLDIEVIVEIARRLETTVFTPGEHIAIPRTLFIVERGICARGGHIKKSGDIWGEDIILDSPQLVDNTTTRSLSYIEVLMLSRQSLAQAVEGLPEMGSKLRRAQVILATVRGFVRVSHLVRGWLVEEHGDHHHDKWAKMSETERLRIIEEAASNLNKGHHEPKVIFEDNSRVSLPRLENAPGPGDDRLLRTLVEQLQHLSNKVDDRFDKIDERVDELSGRVDKVSETVKNVATKVCL